MNKENTKEKLPAPEEKVSNEQTNSERTKQQQTDPNITELKGFIDPNEELEPEGTDNDV